MSAIEILCRYDADQKMPVVFIAHSYDPAAKTIQAWTTGEEIQLVELDYYHTTVALSAQDERILCGRFSKATNQNAVVRHRLPRQARELPSLLSSRAKHVETAPEASKAKRGRKPSVLPTVENTPVLGTLDPALPTPSQLLAAIEQTRVQLVQLTQLASKLIPA